MSQSKKPRTTVLRIVETREAKDRLLSLQEDLLHRILSFVPTLDIVRMSVLSKQWRRMWYSLPFLNFDEQCSLTKFCTFVKEYFKRRKNDFVSEKETANCEITKFRLAIKSSWKIIDSWLKLVGQSKIRELDLEFYKCTEIGPRLTYHVSMESLPVRYLGIFRLTNAVLTGSEPFSFPNLKSLSLVRVKLDDQVVHGLLSGCSVLEKLVVLQCTGLCNPKFFSSSLNTLDIHLTPAQTIQIKAQKLTIFVFVGSQTGSTLSPSPSLEPHGNLKALSLTRVALSEKWLVNLISKLPSLQMLRLVRCQSDRFTISSPHLRRLFFSADQRSCKGLNVKIDTPKLVWFNFKGSPTVSLSLQAQNLSESIVEFHETEYNFEWFSRLIIFLVQLRTSVNVSLLVQSDEALIIPNKMQISCTKLLCRVKELKVVVQKQLKRKRDLMDSMSLITNKVYG